VPIYDYVCETCGHVVEVIHPISASGPATCERCGGPMKRALSAPAIVFKGSGWAKKDARDASRSKSTPAAPGAAPAVSSDAGSTGEGTAAAKDATPAASTASPPSPGSATPSGTSTGTSSASTGGSGPTA